MSINNIFIEYDQNVYTRYKKTSVGAVAGKRLDPNSTVKQRIDFLLISDWKRFNPETNTLTFDYDTDIIEIYNTEEDRVFKILNAYLFQNGYLAPYDGNREVPDMSNMLSDAAVADIAASKNTMSFKKHLRGIDSVVTLKRIKDVAERADRPVSFIRSVEERIKELT